MKVPTGTKEYQDSVRKAKDLLVRLRKGSTLLDESIKNEDLLQSMKIMRHWSNLSKELFTNLEIITLIHQHYTTWNNVLIDSNGKAVKIEDITSEEHTEIDPWTLLSLEKLVVALGEDVKDIIEIK